METVCAVLLCVVILWGHIRMTETQKETSIQPTTKSPQKGTDIHASLSEQPSRPPDSSQTSDLPFFLTSATSGYVKGEKCNKTNTVICTVDASYKLNVPEGHVALISFPVFDMMWDYLSSLGGFAELASIHADGSIIPIWRYNSSRFIPPRLFNTSLSVRLFVPPGDTLTHGFKMVFSIHPTWQIPPQTSEGVFNCSVSFYHTFQDHFHCNLVPECPGEEDEGEHCPFSSEACNGSVAVSNKCYFHYQVQHASSWSEVRRKCQKLGGDLATIKTPAERDAFLEFLRMKNIMNPVYVGLQSFESSMPRIYAKSQVWLDNTVNYQFKTRTWTFNTFYGQTCFVFFLSSLNFRMQTWLNYVPCNNIEYRDYVCQMEVQNISRPLLRFPKGEDFWDKKHSPQSLTSCPGGHVTHTFLSCDPQSQCGTNHYMSHCKAFDEIATQTSASTVMFQCDDSSRTVHYTLLCDFREDCQDKSDETFCLYYTACLDFTCQNGQCVRKRDECNGVRDCWDGSDEVCTYYLTKFPKLVTRIGPPAKIDFYVDGTHIRRVITGCDECSPTHFCCPERYCIPVYCRCNGLGDCINHEDEEDCEQIQCPGFYRCWSSPVCVHASHLCDGWPQCPQHDDEWLCKASCPMGCLCQGHAFRCSYSVPLKPFPLLRYLDASGSGMGPRDTTGLLYLVWLSLSRCGVKQLPEMVLPNILSFDLSHNGLALINMDVFLSLTNLRVLNLSNNPLQSLFSEVSNTKHTRLLVLDLSEAPLTLFNSTVLINYPKLSHLDLSHSALTSISQDGFSSLPNLKEIDLRGADIRHYPSNVFKQLTKLQRIFSGQFKLCCGELLPPEFDESNCFAPEDEISSCADLLRSDTYRTFLWLFSVLSIVGNMGCLLTRAFYLKSKSLTAFSIFVSNLSMADLLMGLYLAMVGGADHVYRGRYIWFEESWKPSFACQLAGFLSFLSSETSALIICLITLDRFLVLTFPFSRLHFRQWSAAVACLLVWLLGFSLASVPLLPAASQWHFYSQTGICIPLPITRTSFKGRDYAFGIMIIFNLVLFILIASGQFMIYWTIRATSSVRSTSNKNKDLTIARRLVSVVVSDFLCWFPIGLLGLLAAHGTPVPGEVNVGMAIFVLPLNAALNPFLYTFNALMEIYKTRQEDRLLKQLEACTVTGTDSLN